MGLEQWNFLQEGAPKPPWPSSKRNVLCLCYLGEQCEYEVRIGWWGGEYWYDDKFIEMVLPVVAWAEMPVIPPRTYSECRMEGNDHTTAIIHARAKARAVWERLYQVEPDIIPFERWFNHVSGLEG